MPLATRLLRKAARRTITRIMDRVGGKVISGMADTSADAPSAGYAPKRDVYSQMQKEEEAAKAGGGAEG